MTEKSKKTETKKPAKAETAEDKALKAAQAEAKAAQKKADKIKKDREKAAATAKLDKDKKAKTDAALRKLDVVAKEVNARFEKAKALDGKADDHRLAAAIVLAKAEDQCTSDKINFKTWSEANVLQGWETVRKLVQVGHSDNPQLALEDMRNKNKAANKKARDKKPSSTASAPAGNQGPKETTFDSAEQHLLRLDDKTREAVVKSVAAKDGLVTMPKTEAEKQRKQIAQISAPVVAGTLNEAVAVFDALKASDKMKLLEHAAKTCGVTLDTGIPTAA